MNTKIIYATAAGAVFSFLAGWLIYGVLLMDFFSSFMSDGFRAMMKDPPEIWAIFLSNAASSLMMAIIFGVYGNIKSFASGLMAGLVIGLLISLSYDLMFYAMSTLYNSRRFYVFDVITGALFSGLTGGVVAAVLGMGKKETSN